jgi:hypothetical protein
MKRNPRGAIGGAKPAGTEKSLFRQDEAKTEHWHECDMCSGSGRVDDIHCLSCAGSGWIDPVRVKDAPAGKKYRG